MTDMADIRAVYLKAKEDCRIVSEAMRVLQNDNAKLKTDLEEAHHTIRLLMRLCSSLITNPNQNPALLTRLNDILDPNERP